jgi:dihydrofolate reductase
MRKLKLQVQMSVDGFVGGPNGELDWMTWDMDDNIGAYINELTNSCDTILLGRKMTDGFVNYWESVKPDSPEYDFAQKMVGYPKYVFTKTLDESPWAHTTLVKGDIVDEVNAIKAQDGKDIVVYGGANFVSSLIKHDLIDEYNLFINPAALGKGLTIFGDISDTFRLSLLAAKQDDCGITVNRYVPVREA